jgi:uncharacterized OB-fold protein
VGDERPVPPLPIPTATSAPFWDALREERLLLQRCDTCRRWVYYPRSHCPSCLRPALTWTAVSGRGRLHTYTVARQPTAPHFAGLEPQLLGVVELEEGPRLTTTLVDVDPEDLRVGLEVVPVFDHVDDEHTLLRYRPA